MMFQEKLLEEIDPKISFVYILHKDKFHKLPIRKQERLSLFLDLREETSSKEMISGFWVCREQKGILNFQAKAHANKSEGDLFDILEFQIDLETLALLNRRDSFRYHCLEPLQSKLRWDGGEMSVEIQNFSSVGLAFQCGVILDALDQYELDIDLDVLNMTGVRASIRPIRIEKWEGKEYTYSYGAKFLAFLSENQVLPFDKVEPKIIRLVNQFLIQERKSRKEQ